MDAWARARTGRPDAKARELIAYLDAVCRPDGRNWSNERVVVFTEYRDTQVWLEQILRSHGLGEDRLTLLFGSMQTDDRELLRLAFQADPTEQPVRILLATDVASEGIDLQNQCHRLINYDIPFNPNKLEQRIGRIDRYGQQQVPQVFHFVGVGWEKATDSYEADLEFLSRVARKVAAMEDDLGTVNAVLAEAVQARMLGRLDPSFDVGAAQAKPVRRRRERGTIAADRNVAEQVSRLRSTIDETIGQLGLSPANVRRVVDTALDLARQQPLQPHLDEKHLTKGLVRVPPLTGSWARTAEGLIDKLTGQQRPITFDRDLIRDPDGRRRDDVVLAHVGHPLVAMSVRLLRAAVWSAETGLHRVAAVVSDDPELTEGSLIAAYARFVLVGADGVRLHEEVLHAGGWLRDGRRFARIDGVARLDAILRRALTDGTAAPTRLQHRFVDAWPRAQKGLRAALDARKREREASLEAKLAKRRDDEKARITAALDRFGGTLRRALDEEPEATLLDLLKDPREIAQARRDRQAWDERLAHLDADRNVQLSRVDARYETPTSHLFPVAVVCVIPEREATR